MTMLCYAGVQYKTYRLLILWLDVIDKYMYTILFIKKATRTDYLYYQLELVLYIDYPCYNNAYYPGDSVNMNLWH